MAELAGKPKDQRIEHEVVIRQTLKQSIVQRLYPSKLIAVGKKLYKRIRTRSLSVANTPETQEWYELDEHTKQLWATHARGQIESPKSPIQRLG